MGNRLSKIATRTGDDGTTGLGDGRRVRKDDARIAAIGEVDELNSNLGVLLCETLAGECAGGAHRDPARPVRSGRRALHSRPHDDCRQASRPARRLARRIQRDAAAAQGVHFARRLTGSRACACVPDGVPSGRAGHRGAWPDRDHQRGAAPIRQPPVGSAVCAGARAQSCGRRQRRALAARARRRSKASA